MRVLDLLTLTFEHKLDISSLAFVTMDWALWDWNGGGECRMHSNFNSILMLYCNTALPHQWL